MSLINTASKIEDTFELSQDQLDAVCGGSPSVHGRGDGLAWLREDLGGGALGEVVTIAVNTAKSVGRALGSLIP